MQVYTDVPLSQILWYKIGGTTKYLLEATTEQDVQKAFDFIFEKNIKKYFIIGLGANLLFTDAYYDGAVIRITSSRTRHSEFDTGSQDQIRSDITVTGDKITAFAGVDLDDVIQSTFKHNLIGLEWAGGLPGTVGAAIRGNVGAFGGEIQDVTQEANVLTIRDNSHTIAVLTNEALNFSYRTSIIKQKKNLIVLSATFQLQFVDQDKIKQAKKVYHENIEYRNTHHPMNFPNTGSCFKNIKEPENVAKILTVWPDVKKLSEEKWHSKIAVGYINKRLGFSGFIIGGAQVSEKHANFINNTGNATALDIKSIIYAIQQKYQETFGFKPEPEVEIVE